jgi:hypothetical protein
MQQKKLEYCHNPKEETYTEKKKKHRKEGHYQTICRRPECRGKSIKGNRRKYQGTFEAG